MIPVAEAQQRLLSLASPLAAETVPIGTAAGRWAGEDVLALRTQPSAALSAMDGYAIRHTDLPGPFQVIGESAAGGRPGAALGHREASRIFTGAALPEGADTILIQEDAATSGTELRLAGDGPAREGEFVRPEGCDFSAREPIIKKGQRLTPAAIALAAAAGHGALSVATMPRIGLIATGSELVPPGAPVPPNGLPASNGLLLAALLADLPCQVTDHGIVDDDLDRLTAIIRRAAASSDIVVTTGGASIGDHDLVRPAIEQAGGTIDFWKVAMRPGKPLIVGRIGNAIILGLPGNPVSALVTATLFLKPLAARLAGAGEPLPRIRAARLGAPIGPTAKREEYLRGIWQDGRVVALANQDSGALLALSQAQVLIRRSIGAGAAQIGDAVEVIEIA